MKQHEKLNYVEFPSRELATTKIFFKQVFGWEFEDYGPDYCAFSDQGLDGGFYRSELYSNAQTGSALLVFYSEDLEATLEKIESAGGRVVKPIFTFPGGRRFHFCEPCDNEFAVWSES